MKANVGVLWNFFDQKLSNSHSRRMASYSLAFDCTFCRWRCRRLRFAILKISMIWCCNSFYVFLYTFFFAVSFRWNHRSDYLHDRLAFRFVQSIAVWKFDLLIFTDILMSANEQQDSTFDVTHYEQVDGFIILSVKTEFYLDFYFSFFISLLDGLMQRSIIMKWWFFLLSFRCELIFVDCWLFFCRTQTPIWWEIERNSSNKAIVRIENNVFLITNHIYYWSTSETQNLIASDSA